MRTNFCSCILISALLTGFTSQPGHAQDTTDKSPDASPTPATTSLDATVVRGRREFQFPMRYRAIHDGLLAVQKAKPELSPNGVFDFRVQAEDASPSNAGRVVTVSLVSANRETVVSTDALLPFNFPLDDVLYQEDPKVIIAGAGPKDFLNIHADSPGIAPKDVRLGDARILCTFLTAARQEMAEGVGWLVHRLVGSFACRLPLPGDPKTDRWVIRFGDKTEDLAAKDGVFYAPTFAKRFPHDAVLSVEPLVPWEPKIGPF